MIVVNKENEGVSIARNVGLGIAKGRCISFVDSDDFINKDMLKITLEIIQNEKENIVEFEYSEVNYSNLDIEDKKRNSSFN